MAGASSSAAAAPPAPTRGCAPGATAGARGLGPVQRRYLPPRSASCTTSSRGCAWSSAPRGRRRAPHLTAGAPPSARLGRPMSHENARAASAPADDGEHRAAPRSSSSSAAAQVSRARPAVTARPSTMPPNRQRALYGRRVATRRRTLRPRRRRCRARSRCWRAVPRNVVARRGPSRSRADQRGPGARRSAPSVGLGRRARPPRRVGVAGPGHNTLPTFVLGFDPVTGVRWSRRRGAGARAGARRRGALPGASRYFA